MKRKMGRKIVEIINNPVPIPIDIFVRILSSLYLVNPKMFKAIGTKNIKERKNITKRFIKVRLTNAKMNRIDTTTVG
jgi:hypothetical protein